MERERRIKRVLYILYSVACAISGFLIFFAAKNGALYSAVFDHILIKVLILGIPAFCCILIDFHYHLYEMVEGPAWATSLVVPALCLLIGYLLIGDKQTVDIFGISISAKLIYILMYAISVVISYLAGLWSIFTGDEPKPKSPTPPPSTSTDTHTTSTDSAGAFGFGDGKNPTHLPDNLKGPY